jgi:hypothetical protein
MLIKELFSPRIIVQSSSKDEIIKILNDTNRQLSLVLISIGEELDNRVKINAEKP